jgi:hypothetical protein
MTLYCSKCGRKISPGGSSYIVRITAISNFDGIIESRDHVNLKTLLKEIEEEVKHLPEDLIEEEVFKEKEFVLCPRCKEIFLANPLGKKLDDMKPPDSIPPP